MEQLNRMKLLSNKIKLKIKILLGAVAISQLISQRGFCESIQCQFVLDKIVAGLASPLNSLIDIEAVHFSEDPIFKTPINRKSKSFNGALKKLLTLYVNTVNENANEKLSLEKGEIYLGHKMPNGASFEFRYVIDQRQEIPRFILDKIKYYKTNMQESEITENPIDEDLQNLNTTGVILAKKKSEKASHYSPVEKSDLKNLLTLNPTEIERAPLDSNGDYLSDVDLNNVFHSLNIPQETKLAGKSWKQIDIKIPFIISGELLDVFIEKSELYHELDRQTVRDSLIGGSLNQLNVLGYKSFLANKMKKVFIKQTVKALIWQVPFFAFIYMINELHSIKKDISNLDDAEPVLVSQEISDMLTEIFDRADVKMDWHNAKLYKQMKDEIKVNLSQNISSLVESSEHLVNWYILKEPDKSKISYLRADEDLTHFTKSSPVEFINKQNSSAAMEHLIFHFPFQNALVLITRSYSNLDPKQMTFESHVVISAKKTPLLYNGLLNIIFKPALPSVAPQAQ
jgi:hypothetical protein